MFEEDLLHLKQQHLYRSLTVVDADNGTHVSIDGKKLLLMCSNDYLGLSSRPELKKAAAAALDQNPFGSGASRLISGNTRLHSELERKIAWFKGTEAALLFNSGYAANTGIIPALVDERDVILSDRLNHASIIDGCRLSKARIHIYDHCDLNRVESVLKESSSARRRLIVTDGVFSMDGDIAPLPGLVLLAEKYDALLMVDDAHATGVLGKTGRGTAEYFGLSNRIPIQMGTLGKALGSFGAYVAGNKDLINYLINKARSFVFSTALPPAVCAASIAAIDIVDREPELRENLLKNRKRLVQGLQSAGISMGGSETAIIPIVVGDSSRAVAASKKLLENGVFASAIRPPTVPEGSARIRITVMATHSEDDIDYAIGVFDRIKREGYPS